MIDFYDVIAASEGIAVADGFAALWGRKISGGYVISTYTGTLPATLQTVAGYLTGYKIWGNTVQNGTPTPENPIMPSGCGVRTENLFDKNNTEGIENNCYISQGTGNIVAHVQYYIAAPIAVTSGETYYWVFHLTSGGVTPSMPTVGFFDANDNQIGVASHRKSSPIFSFIPPANCAYIRASVYKPDINEAMLVKSSTTPTSYVPYGYKLPITSNDATTDIYIGDTQLAKDEYVDSETGKIYRIVDGALTPTDPPAPLPQIPTAAGETIISYGDTGAQPEKVELKYRR